MQGSKRGDTYFRQSKRDENVAESMDVTERRYMIGETRGERTRGKETNFRNWEEERDRRSREGNMC